MDDDLEDILRQAKQWLPSSGKGRLDVSGGYALTHPLSMLIDYRCDKRGLPPPKGKCSKRKAPVVHAAAAGALSAVHSEKVVASKKQKAPLPAQEAPPYPQPETRLALFSVGEVADEEEEDDDDDEGPLKLTWDRLDWPNEGEKTLSYCGNIRALCKYAEKTYNFGAGMKTQCVRQWLKKHPEHLPEWVKDKDYVVDHIIADSIGGVSWPNNYFIMPKAVNSHFRNYADREKQNYVGVAVFKAASSFQKWFRCAAIAKIDFSRYEPVVASFLGR